VSDVTHSLQSLESGAPLAADELLPLVYDQLRRLAAAKMVRENAGRTLQATALVHEALDQAGKRESLLGIEARRRHPPSNCQLTDKKPGFASADDREIEPWFGDFRHRTGNSLKKGLGSGAAPIEYFGILLLLIASMLLQCSRVLARTHLRTV